MMTRMNVPKTMLALGFVGAMLTASATPTLAREHFIRGPVSAFNAVVSPFGYHAYAYDPYRVSPRGYRRGRGYGDFRDPYHLWDPYGMRWE
jgi:hypothetical protein